MKLVTVGSVAFDAIETPFGKTDKIVGGAGTFISLASSFFAKEQGLISVVGEDFPSEAIQMLKNKSGKIVNAYNALKMADQIVNGKK